MPRHRVTTKAPSEIDNAAAPEEPELSNAEFKRMLSNGFKFWVMCRARRCQRARGYAGEPVACFARHWAIVPEEFKLRCHTIAEGRLQGLSPEEAIAYADKRLAQFEAAKAKFAGAAAGHADSDAAEAHDAAPEPDDAPAMPRLRSL